MARRSDRSFPLSEDDGHQRRKGQPVFSRETVLRREVKRRILRYHFAKGAIDLSKLKINDEDIIWVVGMLTAVPLLKTLEIGYNSIGDAGVVEIAERLTNLKRLDLSDNSIGQVGAEAIARSFPHLTILNIRRNLIGDRGIAAIVKQHPGLAKLYLGYNAIGPAGASAIAEHLSQIETLHIGYNPIGDQGVSMIGDRLTSLTELGASGISITEVGIAAVAKHLKNLHTLYVSGNRLGDFGAAELAANLDLSHLATLDISACSIEQAELVVKLLERLVTGQSSGKRRLEVKVHHNPLKWSGISAPISEDVLRETNPRKLRNLLVSLRESGADLSAAGLAFIGRTEHGKTHAARWTVAGETEFEPLRQEIPKGQRTWGYDRYATTLGRLKHGRTDLGDLYLTVVDVGGHREQLNSACNLVYMNARRSVFVLVLKASENFREGNWGRYYLRLIESLRARKRSIEDGRRHGIYELAEAGPDERIPVLILITHARLTKRIELPTPTQLQSDYPLLDIACLEEWDAPEGDKYLPSLYAKLGGQLGKLQSLRGLTVGFIKSLMEKIRQMFQLDEQTNREVPPRIGSLSLGEFRRICTDIGGSTIGEQHVALRELASFGYLALSGRTTRLREDVRLLNPRFVSHYLFERILRDHRTRANNGYLQADWLEEIMEDIAQQADRDELLKLMDECLVAFDWEEQGWSPGKFVPDLLPVRKREDCPVWRDAQCRVRLKPIGFLSEDSFFRFLARKKQQLRVMQTDIRPDRSRRDVLLFRNQCIMGDADHPDDDKSTALIHVDVIAEEVVIDVRASNYSSAKSFGDGLIAQLKEYAGCGFEGIWELGAFEKLASDLRGTSETVARSRAIIKWMTTRLSPAQMLHAISGPRMGGWVKHGSDDAEYHTDETCWMLVKRSVEFLASPERLVLDRHENGGYVLTRDVGIPFIEWLKRTNDFEF